MSIAFSKESLKLSQDLQVLTGENALLCYQCKRCTLGCPSAYAMRMKPHEMMRALQLGLKDEIYWSGAIWICISCETCNTPVSSKDQYPQSHQWLERTRPRKKGRLL